VEALGRVVQKVVERAEARDCLIVAWSEHELTVIKRHLSGRRKLVDRFEARYRNARRVAERWVNKCHPDDKPPTGRLQDYLPLIGYVVPEDAVGGDVGAAIGLISERYAHGKLPTAGQVERWDRLIEHNRHDCIGMRQLCLIATKEIDATNASK
jgi:hypothetical protein